MGLGGTLSDPSAILKIHQKRVIQVIAISTASCSIIACLATVYWFFMMRRNFRRQLVFLLILGDLSKSTCYLVFSAAALSVGGITSHSPFCQVNGFLLQASVEACDLAILFMSIHMYLQIFNTNSKLFGHDGLYRVRYLVLAFWTLMPTVSASLAFVRSSEGYISQGPFCTLPIRPYWYRLALQWIPRYLIWFTIMFVAIRIYVHAGTGFKVFARQDDKATSDGFGVASSDMNVMEQLKITKKRLAGPSIAAGDQQDGSGLLSFHSVQVPSGGSDRRPMSIHWPPNMNLLGTDWGKPLPSAANSRRGSRVEACADGSMPSDYLQIPSPQKRPFGSISTMSSFKSTGEISVDGMRSPELHPIDERYVTHREDGPDMLSADTPMKKRRRAIQRQLRLLFIYPVVYMIFWTVPFVFHSMNYSDYYAAHPVFILAALATCFTCLLGFADCFVFCWREKPWQQIPGSDGTFWGSFKFWSFHEGLTRWSSTPAPQQIPTATESSIQRWTAKLKPGMNRSSSSNSVKPMLHKKTYSGHSERATMQAERAAERLALERQDRESRMPAAFVRDPAAASKRRTEWWERPLSQAFLDTPMREEDAFEFQTVPESLPHPEAMPETIREESVREDSVHEESAHPVHSSFE
ncbi:hypothetical protein MBLNU459_g7373t1 [Dothideomycetes sp. NU459]